MAELSLFCPVCKIGHMRPRIISLLILTSIIILPFDVANAVNNDTSRTFFRCYTSISSAFLMINQLTPAAVDLTDPQMKAYISNLCNFYHEKTGMWFNFFTDKPDPKLSEEFDLKYGSTMPDSMKEFANMSILD